MTATGDKNDQRLAPGPRPSETRKIRKPLMERKRRARINQSLDIIKELLLEANAVPADKEGNRPAKLEKADILELTIAYIQSLPVLDTCPRAESESTSQKSRYSNFDVTSIKFDVSQQESTTMTAVDVMSISSEHHHEHVYRYRLLGGGIWRPW